MRFKVYWINVRDPLYFLGYGIPYIYEKGSFLLPGVMWAKFRVFPQSPEPLLENTGLAISRFLGTEARPITLSPKDLNWDEIRGPIDL